MLHCCSHKMDYTGANHIFPVNMVVCGMAIKKQNIISSKSIGRETVQLHR